MNANKMAPEAAEAARPAFGESWLRGDLPESAPLAMPPQNLRAWRGRTPAPASAVDACARRRLALFVAGALLATLAEAATYRVFRHDGLAAYEILSLLVFAPLAFGLAFWFCNAAAGFLVLARGADDPLNIVAAQPVPPRGRCALLAPIFNEDCAAVFARLTAMTDALAREGGGAFDLFVLSDTNQPAIAGAERRGVDRLRARAAMDVYYRRRLTNTDNKAGNIADWVRQFGGAYETMIVLDADSVMSADLMLRLACAMDRHPGVGVIQTLPTIVGARSLFARYLQFGSAVFGPAAWSGLAWWTGAEGSYWGHNAIVRVRAFAAHAGLPKLDGPRPFGGFVMSHDVVEAALLRRAGWAVHMAPPLAGSFEEAPPTLADFVKRDRRWCQGNLQHLSLLWTPGLHWVSRFQLGAGIAAYLFSPLFVLFLVLGVGAGAVETLAQGGRPSFLAYGPSLGDALRAGLLTALLVVGPKLLGLVRILADRAQRRSFGGAPALLAGALAELAVSALLAPLLIAAQTKAIIEILRGRDSGWSAQRRSAEEAGADAPFEWMTVLGFLAACFAQFAGAFAAMAPMLAGLIAAGPLARAGAREDLGHRSRQAGLFGTPEEADPPPILGSSGVYAPLIAQPEPDALTRVA